MLLNDFEQKLIKLGFVPVDEKKFINLVESINRNGDNTRFVITVEKLNEKFYKYSENSWEDNKFSYFSTSFVGLEIDSIQRFNRLFDLTKI